MPQPVLHQPDPALDLVFERLVDVSPEVLWKFWTQPEQLKRWFTPAPWQTVDCEIDLRPGGMFRTVMRSPEGTDYPNTGCYLEIVENRKLAWTNALLPGYRPSPAPSIPGVDDFPFTAVVSLEPRPHGARYTALVIHADEAGCRRHAAMGFHEGWGKALDQLLAIAGDLRV